jgi:chorismate synthase
MSSIWGHKVKVSLFGESHGPAIGCVIDGLPAGLAIDFSLVDAQMLKRAPGQSPLSSSRSERDQYEVLSGVFDGHTTGAPLAAIIRNEDVDSGEYEPEILRPGHADYTAYIKYKGFSDHRGGGHFSGRLTAPVVFAGAIVRQILAQKNIVIGSRIFSIFNILDEEMPASEILQLPQDLFPVKNPFSKEEMQRAILVAKSEGDSLGGVVECVVGNLPIGLGEPFFHSIESNLSALLFSIPAVKAVEFGDGFAISQLRGSQANDSMYYKDESIHFTSNHNGGIIGGITNGQPLVCRVAVKPTPSIGAPQTTVNVKKAETVVNSFKGRHDPCIVPRALPVIESVLALGLYDFM